MKTPIHVVTKTALAVGSLLLALLLGHAIRQQSPTTLSAPFTPVALFDPGSADSAVVVTNLTAPLAKVMVSACIRHPQVQDLDLYLLAPDLTGTNRYYRLRRP